MELQRGLVYANDRVHAEHSLKQASVRGFLAVLIVLAAVSSATAQISVEVSPLRVELQAMAGSTTTQAVTLNNAGKEPVRIRARISDWDLSRDGAPQFEGAVENGPYSASSWIRIAPPEQVVDPGKDGTVRFSLTVPVRCSRRATGPASCSSSSRHQRVPWPRDAKCSFAAASPR